MYRNNITNQIVADLGAGIVRGVYAGEKAFPVEAKLCEHYGASRSVLREAVKMLSAKGLLRSAPRRGTEVQPEERWNILDPDVLVWFLERKRSIPLMLEFMDVRLSVEPAAAALAASCGDEADLEKIKAAFGRMKDAARGEDNQLDSDIAFHRSILAASGNRFFKELEHLVDVALRYSLPTTNQIKGVTKVSVEQHERVALAIFDRDAQKARSAMEGILRDAKSLLSEELKHR